MVHRYGSGSSSSSVRYQISIVIRFGDERHEKKGMIDKIKDKLSGGGGR
ncbi:unnamed protein product [Brassica oleracea]